MLRFDIKGVHTLYKKRGTRVRAGVHTALIANRQRGLAGWCSCASRGPTASQSKSFPLSSRNAHTPLESKRRRQTQTRVLVKSDTYDVANCTCF